MFGARRRRRRRRRRRPELEAAPKGCKRRATNWDATARRRSGAEEKKARINFGRSRLLCSWPRRAQRLAWAPPEAAQLQLSRINFMRTKAVSPCFACAPAVQSLGLLYLHCRRTAVASSTPYRARTIPSLRFGRQHCDRRRQPCRIAARLAAAIVVGVVKWGRAGSQVFGAFLGIHAPGAVHESRHTVSGGQGTINKHVTDSGSL